MSGELKPGTICMLIGVLEADMYKLVTFNCMEDTSDGRLANCTALQHIFGERVPGTRHDLPKFNPGDEMHIPRQNLKPLHDGDGVDEVLRITGKPNTQEKQKEKVRG